MDLYLVWHKDEHGIRVVAVFWDSFLMGRFLGCTEHPWDFYIQYA